MKTPRCEHCNKFTKSLDNGWCKACADNYDGPSDDELSTFYGGGEVRPMEEQYREAAEQKAKLDRIADWSSRHIVNWSKTL